MTDTTTPTMPNLRAVVVSACIEMRIEYPAAVQAALAGERADIEAALVTMPAFARPMVKPHYDLSPTISAWIEGLDYEAIRAEMARKAKKIGLQIAGDAVGIGYDTSGVTLTQTAKGRS